MHLVDASPRSLRSTLSPAVTLPVSRDSRLSVAELHLADWLCRRTVQAIQENVLPCHHYTSHANPVLQRVQREFEQQQVALSKIFGSHMPMRLQMEHHVLAQRQRYIFKTI